MLTKFWETISSNAAERWLDHLFGPAFLFWVGGLGLNVWQIGWQAWIQNAWALDQFQLMSWTILALFVLIFSSVLMQAIRFPILRLLEGYWAWPLSYLGLGIVALQKIFFRKNYDELRRLMQALKDQDELDDSQRAKLLELDDWAHRHPANSNDLLPTALGNILRARERSPEHKYGLDAIVCWPRLWPLLPENVRSDLSSTRSTLDRLVELWFWGLLFLLWSFVSLWAAAIGLLWMMLTYSMARQAAMAYGDLLESAFDLYRFSLYDAMSWPRPKNAREEQTVGAKLTEYLWRGTGAQKISYRRNKQKI